MTIQKSTQDKIENIFEEQHHHLLSCLEHATVLFTKISHHIFHQVILVVKYNLG